MGAPQIIVLMLFLVYLLGNANLHGKPIVGKYSIWSSLVCTALYYWLLLWGGFFG